MGNITSGLSSVSQVGGKGRSDDDFADRLSHRFSVILLMLCVFVVTGRTYVGHPIDCWCPARFKDSHIDYANSLCWTKNTYYIPIGEDIPREDELRENEEIGYYQWVPIVLLIQALIFYLPKLVWAALHTKAGVNINDIAKVVNDKKNLDPEHRTRTVKYIVRHLDRMLESHADLKSGCCPNLKAALSHKICFMCGRKYGTYMITVYVFVKLLYIGNGIGQLFLLNAFLGSGTEYTLYGFGVISDLFMRRDWTTSRHFPRVTLCDFKIREFASNTHRYTLQCVLPINLFNEKIYILLWFWFVLVCVATVYSTLSWISAICSVNRANYIKKFLKNMSRYNREDKKLLKKFTNHYLKSDGVFIIRMLTKNTSDVIVAEIVVGLWDHFTKMSGNTHKNVNVKSPLIFNN